MRVLFTSLPQAGHLHPLLPVAHALRDAGHEVLFACPPPFVPRVEAAGFKAVAAGFNDGGQPFPSLFPGVDKYPTHDRGTWVVSRGFIGVYGAVMAAHLFNVCHEWKPDLIVRDTSEFGGCIVADALGIPHASVRTGALTATYALRHRWTEALAVLRERAGLEADPDGEMLFRYLHLAMEPPEFARPGDTPAPTAHVLRPEIPEIATSAVPTWIAALPVRPTIYATLGTVFGGYPAGRATFTAILDALRDEDCNLIATVGNDVDPADFGPQPEHVRIERFVPQEQLLPRCDIVVNQGGFGTITGALNAGIPMVLLPIGADQPLNAACCERLKVGVVVQPDERTPRAIQEAIRTVLATPAYRENAQLVRSKIRALPGLDRAVQLLERLAKDRQPIPAGT